MVDKSSTSGKIHGVSLAALLAGTRSAEHYFGVRGAHDRAGVDAATVFEAASLTKPLVAYVALQLVEEGLLDLQKPLFDICGEYVPGDTNSRRIATESLPLFV
ncbi:serine hydrolase [Paraburkholderia sp. MM5477-R1]|uniref:serine hydrolase n=1 Tax=Paraburkholderia sp. MM5477-R1 TaxID=2991062 RepID=UPI003D1D410F